MAAREGVINAAAECVLFRLTVSMISARLGTLLVFSRLPWCVLEAR